MSRSLQEYHNISDARSVPSRTKADVEIAISKLDNRLKHLSESVLPKQPYLLSVPSEVPYRHNLRFVNTWYLDTPFKKNEEQLQYVSFLPHQGEHESLLHVVGGWSDEQGNIFEDQPSPQEIIVSGRNTPSEPANRKKISLKDYKSKDKPVSQTRSEVRSPVRDSSQRETSRSFLDAKLPRSPQIQLDSKYKTGSTSPQNSVNMVDGAASSSSSSPDTYEASSRTLKRRKLSNGDAQMQTNAHASPQIGSTAKNKSIPALLSPTLPSPERGSGPPDLLSPILPPSLAKAIAASTPRSLSVEKNGNHHRTDSVRSILAQAGIEGSPLPNDKAGLMNSFDGNRVRSDSQHSHRSNASGTAVHNKGNLTPKPFVKTPQKLAASLHSEIKVSPGPRQRHTIILKYGKKNRKRVEGLLKFAPRPKKPAVRAIQADSNHQTNVKKEPTRRLSVSPEAIVRKRLSETDRRPNTPVLLNSKSDAGTISTKSIFSTPKKDLKSSSMQRVVSADGGNTPTPIGEKGRVSTPLSAERSSQPPKASPSSGSNPNNREDTDRSRWNQIHLKHFALGRTIKHEATALGSSPGNSNTTDNTKSIVLLIEALLCFMVNTAAQSYARPNQDPGWSTIIPYHIFVFRASRKLPHLHGLVVQLGAICRQLIHKHDMDRLARDPLPDDSSGSAPTPGSDGGQTKTNEDSEKYKKRYIQFRDDLVRNAKELQTAWLDGSRLLSLEVLEHEYPETWRKRNKDSSQRGTERPLPMNISKDFYLPLDANTGAFEAMRFSLTFLDEWTRKANVEWKARIDL